MVPLDAPAVSVKASVPLLGSVCVAVREMFVLTHAAFENNCE
jgi:hypothetical protein